MSKKQTETSENTDLHILGSAHENYGLIHGTSYGWDFPTYGESKEDSEVSFSFWSAYTRLRRYRTFPTNS